MSAGHAHSRPNQRHPNELRKLEADPSFHAMAVRKFTVVTTKDVPDLAGYNVLATNVYIDQDFVAALRGGQIVVRGMTPAQVAHAVVTHEWTEKCDLDADNPTRTYQAAHEIATLAEHEFVRSCGATPRDYERALAGIIKVCAEKPVVNPPIDLDCEPYVDRPDKNDRRILKVFRRMGVLDAGKTPKEHVDYSPSTGADRCDGCEHWQAADQQELSGCDLVAGAVRNSWWCSKYLAKEQDGAPASPPGSPRSPAPARPTPQVNPLLDHHRHAFWRSRRGGRSA